MAVYDQIVFVVRLCSDAYHTGLSVVHLHVRLFSFTYVFFLYLGNGLMDLAEFWYMIRDLFVRYFYTNQGGGICMCMPLFLISVTAGRIALNIDMWEEGPTNYVCYRSYGWGTYICTCALFYRNSGMADALR